MPEEYRLVKLGVWVGVDRAEVGVEAEPEAGLRAEVRGVVSFVDRADFLGVEGAEVRRVKGVVMDVDIVSLETFDEGRGRVIDIDIGS